MPKPQLFGMEVIARPVFSTQIPIKLRNATLDESYTILVPKHSRSRDARVRLG
jgi:hypothetical protein